MEPLFQKIDVFLKKYSSSIHIFLTAWNLIIVGWATGIPVNLEAIGIPYTIDVRSIISYLQLHAHIPTYVLAIVGFAANATIAYSAWRKKHVNIVDVAPGDVLIAHPTDAPVPVQQVQLNIKDDKKPEGK